VYLDRYPASGSVRRRNALDLTRDVRDDQRQVQLRRFDEGDTMSFEKAGLDEYISSREQFECFLSRPVTQEADAISYAQFVSQGFQHFFVRAGAKYLYRDVGHARSRADQRRIILLGRQTTGRDNSAPPWPLVPLGGQDG